MATVPLNTKIRRIQLRSDEPSLWVARNPVLLDGEMGLEKSTKLFKIGDGVTPWNDLEYGGMSGPPGENGFISTDADNVLSYGTDGGLYMSESDDDLLTIYEISKN